MKGFEVISRSSTYKKMESDGSISLLAILIVSPLGFEDYPLGETEPYFVAEEGGKEGPNEEILDITYSVPEYIPPSTRGDGEIMSSFDGAKQEAKKRERESVLNGYRGERGEVHGSRIENIITLSDSLFHGPRIDNFPAFRAMNIAVPKGKGDRHPSSRGGYLKKMGDGPQAVLIDGEIHDTSSRSKIRDVTDPGLLNIRYDYEQGALLSSGYGDASFRVVFVGNYDWGTEMLTVLDILVPDLPELPLEDRILALSKMEVASSDVTHDVSLHEHMAHGTGILSFARGLYVMEDYPDDSVLAYFSSMGGSGDIIALHPDHAYGIEGNQPAFYQV